MPLSKHFQIIVDVVNKKISLMELESHPVF